MNELVVAPQTNMEAFRASTDAAEMCRAIVLKTAMEIERRKYVKVEGWQAIAIAHGCTASAKDVERVDGGVRATGEVRRMSDGALIAQGEGFVGEDETTWYGGDVMKDVWEGPYGNRRKTGRKELTKMPKRADYAIRAMAQTRAISRACRAAFAHVVVMIDENLSTTPAEEVPEGGFSDRFDASSEATPGSDEIALTAAMTAITMAETRADLTVWKEANPVGSPLEKMLSAEQWKKLGAHLKARWLALAPAKDGDGSGVIDAEFSEPTADETASANVEADPFAEPAQ